MHYLRYFFVLSLLLFPNLSFAEEISGCCQVKYKGHRFLFGPEVYHVHRDREGGTKQNGWLGGGRFLYDHMRRYTFYWGVEGAFAQGGLKGKSGSQARLKSHMRDRSIESRFGYTFQYKHDHKFALTPFFGVGYLIEENNFKHPTVLHLHFKTSYRYLTAGFIASATIFHKLDVSLNVKLRYLLDPKCKITNDPEFDRAQLNIDNNAIQYRIELPITYAYSTLSFVTTPFYESRCYGKNAGYPFDFLRTRLFNYGLTMQAFIAF